ncbi:MAG: c-type cytochrome, partial [Myxococcota bacterium]
MTLSLTVFFVGGCDPAAEALALSADIHQGAERYANVCGSCHGATGEGGTAPSMTTVVPAHSDEQLAHIMLYGVGEMPATNLSTQEVADVLGYLRE